MRQLVVVFLLAHARFGVGYAADEVVACYDDRREQRLYILLMHTALIERYGNAFCKHIIANGLDGSNGLNCLLSK